jgi:enoyl-CoA hydratase/carnithine racemase
MQWSGLQACYDFGPMDYRTLRIEIEPPIARVTLSRPATANRVDERCVRELEAACESIAATEAVVVTLLTAEGSDFCAGWALEAKEPTANQGDLRVDPFSPLAGLSCPVVAAVQGECFSAGLELALACDVRIAAADARFALPEVARGDLPRAGGSQRLPRLVGRSVATSMLLLGDELDAEAAFRAGLVSRVVPAAGLPAAADALVAQIAARGPLALRYAKEAVRHGLELPLDQALRYELDLSIILQTTADRAEGVQAFLEKRPPRFEGR